jgi:Ala-tRNA(Pro) deacylase
MSDTVFERLENHLREHDVPFDVTRHQPVYTSEEAARVRGTSLASGAKALICKVEDRFVMFVLPADRRLANKAIRRQLGARKLRFASRDEVLELTGLTPGSIPPFGSLFELPTWCDDGLAAQNEINFNAGDHTISISMAYSDYVAIERPTIAPVSEASD